MHGMNTKQKETLTFYAAWGPECSRWYSDQARGWTIQGSNSDRRKRPFSSPQRPARRWAPLGLLFNTYWGSHLGLKRAGREHIHSAPSSAEVRMSGGIILLSTYTFIQWTATTLAIFRRLRQIA